MQRLMKIQQTLKAPKNQRNNFGGYNYRNCEDILEAVKPLLAENNLILNLEDDIVVIGERYYIKSTVTLFDTDGKLIKETHAFAREEENKKGMDASQITGACSSYARKYALNGLFCIDDGKDADSRKPENTTVSNKTANDMEILKKINNFTEINLLKEFYNVNKELVKDKKLLNQKVNERVRQIKAGKGANDNG